MGASPGARVYRERVDQRLKARLLGLGVISAGAVNVVSALTPAWRARLHIANEIVTPDAARFAAGATALFGLGLILLGRGVAQRRRVAHRAALVLLFLSALAHIAKGLDVEESFFVVSLGLFLVWGHRMFLVDHEPARWRAVAHRAAVLIGMNFAYGFAGLLLRRHSLHPTLTFARGLREVGARLIGFVGPLRIDGRFGHWFPASITVLGAVSIGAILLLLLSPVAERGIAHRRDRDLVRALMNRADGDTLDPFALRADKRYVFSTDRRAAIAYRYVTGVALAAGEPVGEPSSFEDALGRYVAMCDARGWRPAIVGVREQRLPMYGALGFRAVYLGDEAIIDVPQFTLEGRKIRNVRQSAVHARREGCTVEFAYEADLDPTLKRALVGISDSWRADHPERGFSMALGWMFTGRNPECVVIVCRDGSGAPVAFIRLAPCRGGRALSLDVMRRDPDAPGGVNELMITEAVVWARERGIDELSLNFAAFREIIDPGSDKSRIKHAQGWLLRKLDPYFQLESLRSFNGKFRPRWTPRYAVYRSRSDIAAIAVAGLSAEAFLPFDKRKDVPEHEPIEAAATDARTEAEVEADAEAERRSAHDARHAHHARNTARR
jgi:lysyl-tRNA synthetase class 2